MQFTRTTSTEYTRRELQSELKAIRANAAAYGITDEDFLVALGQLKLNGKTDTLRQYMERALELGTVELFEEPEVELIEEIDAAMASYEARTEATKAELADFLNEVNSLEAGYLAELEADIVSEGACSAEQMTLNAWVATTTTVSAFIRVFFTVVLAIVCAGSAYRRWVTASTQAFYAWQRASWGEFKVATSLEDWAPVVVRLLCKAGGAISQWEVKWDGLETFVGRKVDALVAITFEV